MIIVCAENFILHTVFGQIEDDVANYTSIFAHSVGVNSVYRNVALERTIFRAMGNSKVSLDTSLYESCKHSR